MTDLMTELPDTLSDAFPLPPLPPQAPSQLLLTLQELIEALDRRIPQIERAGEAEITADAVRLRACAMHRMALLRRPGQWEFQLSADRRRILVAVTPTADSDEECS